jgi:hypothetical protein
VDIGNSVYLLNPSPTFTIEDPHLHHVSGSEPQVWEAASFFDSEYNAWRSDPHSPSSAEPAVDEVECYWSTHETERPAPPSLPLWESDLQDQVWENFVNADLETDHSSDLNSLSTLPLPDGIKFASYTTSYDSGHRATSSERASVSLSTPSTNANEQTSSSLGSISPAPSSQEVASTYGQPQMLIQRSTLRVPCPKCSLGFPSRLQLE